jgi:hypothetical protein
MPSCDPVLGTGHQTARSVPELTILEAAGMKKAGDRPASSKSLYSAEKPQA